MKGMKAILAATGILCGYFVGKTLVSRLMRKGQSVDEEEGRNDYPNYKPDTGIDTKMVVGIRSISR